MRVALPTEIEVHEDVDGLRFVLPGRAENPIRRQAGMLLVVIGVTDTVIVSAIVLSVLIFASPNTQPAVILAAVGAIVVSGFAIVTFGRWLTSARTEIIIGPDSIRSVTRLGAIRVTRRRRLSDVARITLTRERIKGVNIPGAREGHPDFLTLAAAGPPGVATPAPGSTPAPAPGSGSRSTILATGHHRRVLAPLAAAIAAKLGLPPPGETAGP